MCRAFPAVLLAICLMMTGCGSSPAIVASTSDPTSSGSPSPTPTATPSPGASNTAPVDDEQTPQDSPDEQVAEPVPAPSETRGPDEVDPADYTSDAVDPQNGNIPLPGVAFRTADGLIICGILTSGYVAGQAGSGSCTIDSYRDVIPQPADREPFVKSVMADPTTGSYFLYPDRFAHPDREIPVLAAGKSIRFEGTSCSVNSDSVTCVISSTGRGFTISQSAYQLF